LLIPQAVSACSPGSLPSLTKKKEEDPYAEIEVDVHDVDEDDGLGGPGPSTEKRSLRQKASTTALIATASAIEAEAEQTEDPYLLPAADAPAAKTQPIAACNNEEQGGYVEVDDGEDLYMRPTAAKRMSTGYETGQVLDLYLQPGTSLGVLH
jgi:hypothetical protein